MRQTVILLSFLLLGYNLRAQQGYFITIDADENQNFSVSVGKKFYSSSSIGHLVVPNLKDSVYKLSFNFPGTEYKQQVFTVKMDKRDKGLRLKKNSEKTWSLLDRQTMDWIHADAEAAVDPATLNKTVSPEKPDPRKKTSKKVDEEIKQPTGGNTQANTNKSVSPERTDPPKKTSEKVDEELKQPTGINTQSTEEKKQPADEKKLLPEEINPPASVKSNPGSEKAPANQERGSADQDTPSTTKTNNAFARLMAGVVNDTAVMYNTTLRAPKKKVDTLAKKAELKVKEEDTVAVVKKKPDSMGVAVKPKVDKSVATNSKGTKKSHTEKDGKDTREDIGDLSKKSDADAKKAVGVVAAKPNAADDSSAKQPRSQLPDSAVVNVQAPVSKPGVKLIHERYLAGAREFLYVETGPDGKRDTIDISIALEAKKGNDSSGVGSSVSKDSAAHKKDSVEQNNDTVTKKGEVRLDSDTNAVNAVKSVSDPTKSKDNAAKKIAAGSGVAATVANAETDNRNTAKKAGDSLIVSRNAPDSAVKAAEKGPEPVVTKTNTAKPADSSVAKSGEPVSKEGAAEPAEKKVVLINSDCKAFATDNDVDKLRVKLLAESNLDERVIAAKKIFRTKCFTTKQIRALSELFLSDNARYTFFDAAYPFVSDTANFKTLIDLFTDEYYIGRFKAMVRM